MTIKAMLMAVATVSISGLSYTAFAGDCGVKAAKAGACGVQTVATEAPCSPEAAAAKAAACGAQTVATTGSTPASCSSEAKTAKTGACSAEGKAVTVSTETPAVKKEGACSETVAADGTKKDGCCGPKDLSAVISKHEKLTTLAGLLKSSGLDKDLAGEKKMTIFAPTDEAFAKLPEATLEMLAKPENKDQLKAILTSHVMDGATTSCCFTDGQVVKSASGQELKLVVKDGKVSVNGASVVTANVEATNGVVHAIDTVILPTRG